MHYDLKEKYERILEVLKKISNENLLPYQRRTLKLKDLGLISLALTAEFMGIDSENHLFRQIPKTIKYSEVFTIVVKADWLIKSMIYE